MTKPSLDELFPDATAETSTASAPASPVESAPEPAQTSSSAPAESPVQAEAGGGDDSRLSDAALEALEAKSRIGHNGQLTRRQYQQLLQERDARHQEFQQAYDSLAERLEAALAERLPKPDPPAPPDFIEDPNAALAHALESRIAPLVETVQAMQQRQQDEVYMARHQAEIRAKHEAGVSALDAMETEYAATPTGRDFKNRFATFVSAVEREYGPETPAYVGAVMQQSFGLARTIGSHPVAEFDRAIRRLLGRGNGTVPTNGSAVDEEISQTRAALRSPTAGSISEVGRGGGGGTTGQALVRGGKVPTAGALREAARRRAREDGITYQDALHRVQDEMYA